MENFVYKKVKKILSKDREQKTYPIAYCFLGFVTWIAFNLNQEQFKNFKEFSKAKLENKIKPKDIFDDINKQLDNDNINLDKYLDLVGNIKFNKNLAIIFSNYLQAIIAYASIDEFKYFFEKDFKIETYNASASKFIDYLNKMSVVNNCIKEMFPYNYASIIDFTKNIKKKAFEK